MVTHEQNHKAILVVGGAGYIGSHLVKQLKDSNFLPIVLDNLSSGRKTSTPDTIFYEGDVADTTLIEQIYAMTPFASVIHLAGFIEVGESIQKPLNYYQNNIASTLALLHVMKKLGVKNLVFSSSAAIYGNPISNSALQESAPKTPVNPYGKSKWMIEQILADCSLADRMNIIALRFFNVAGGNPMHPHYKRKEISTHLIPLVLQAAKKKTPITIFGNDYPTPDGTAIRDYIHVMDICDAHILALHALFQNILTQPYSAFNLGTGNGYSVSQVIRVAESITREKITIRIADRRPGDPVSLIADGSLAKKILAWNPHRSELKTIIQDAWLLEQCMLKSEVEFEHAI